MTTVTITRAGIAKILERHGREHVRYPIEVDITVTEQCYDEIRKKLVALGDGGVIMERGDRRSIDLTGVTIVTKGSQDVRTQPPSLTKLRDR